MIPVMAVLASMVLFTGMIPRFFLKHYFAPAAMASSRVPDLVETGLHSLSFWNAKDIQGTMLVFLLGTMLFVLGRHFHFLYIQLPRWASAERIMLHPVLSFFERFSRYCVRKYEAPIISGDALIYALVLFSIMVLLVVGRFI